MKQCYLLCIEDERSSITCINGNLEGLNTNLGAKHGLPMPTIVWGPGNQEDAEEWALLNGWVPKEGEVVWDRDDDSPTSFLRLQWY